VKIKTNSEFLLDETVAGDPGAADAATPVSGAGSDVDWVEMSTPDSDGTTPVGAGEGKSSPPVVEPAAPLPDTPVSTATSAPAATPAPAVVAPVTPPATPPATPAAVTPAPTAPVSEQPETPAPSAAPDFQTLRANEFSRLQQQYALSEEEQRLALTQPEAILPKMAASLHLNVLESVVNTIMSRVPEVVRMVTKTESEGQQNENEFYTTWPMLKDPKYKQTVYNAVAAYRQINRNATKDEVIRAAGLQALISLRLPIPQHLLETSAPPPSTTGFVPASPGSGGQPSPATMRPGAPNPFAVLSEEFLSDDRR
jgi:hypothetical protein